MEFTEVVSSTSKDAKAQTHMLEKEIKSKNFLDEPSVFSSRAFTTGGLRKNVHNIFNSFRQNKRVLSEFLYYKSLVDGEQHAPCSDFALKIHENLRNSKRSSSEFHTRKLSSLIIHGVYQKKKKDSIEASSRSEYNDSVSKENKEQFYC